MDEEQFLFTMREHVKYNIQNYDYLGVSEKDKDSLLKILGKSIVIFDKKSDMTGVLDQHQEIIELRVSITMFSNAMEYEDVFKKLIYDVYIPSNSYSCSGMRIKPKPIGLSIQTQIEHNAYFNDIQKKIIKGIREAKYLIWVAVHGLLTKR